MYKIFMFVSYIWMALLCGCTQQDIQSDAEHNSVMHPGLAKYQCEFDTDDAAIRVYNEMLKEAPEGELLPSWQEIKEKFYIRRKFPHLEKRAMSWLLRGIGPPNDRLSFTFVKGEYPIRGSYGNIFESKVTWGDKTKVKIQVFRWKMDKHYLYAWFQNLNGQWVVCQVVREQESMSHW